MTLTKDDIFKQMSPLIADKLCVDPTQVTLEASLRSDLNAESLDLLELFMTLDERFKIKIPEEDLKAALTIGDVVDYIYDRLIKQEEGVPA